MKIVETTAMAPPDPTLAPKRSRKTVAAKAAAPERVAAFRIGLSAESRAAAYLIAKGYRILARRFRTPYGEIDIVAKRRGLLAFVEVKARSEIEAATFALRGYQFGRVARAASLFVARHPQYAAHSLRFDAVLVVGFWPRHLPDVWRAPE
jgi:putative endonuclease